MSHRLSPTSTTRVGTGARAAAAATLSTHKKSLKEQAELIAECISSDDDDETPSSPTHPTIKRPPKDEGAQQSGNELDSNPKVTRLNSVDQGSHKSSFTSASPSPSPSASPSSSLSSSVLASKDENDSNNQQPQETSILPIKSRQAFNITKVTLPPQFSIPTITIDTNEFEYALKMKVFDAWAIPTFVLMFLSFNPGIMLPLASLREPLFESALQLTEDTFYTNPNYCGPADLFPTLLHSIVCGRLGEIIYRNYPRYKSFYSNSSFRDAFRPHMRELERGPIPELQAIVEDSMVVFNPIKVLISFLGAMVDKYRSLDLPIDQDELADVLLDDDFVLWLSSASMLSCTYGLFLWDSSLWGVSDAEWDALVQHMTAITTEIFPNAYERISSIGGSHRTIGSCDATLNDFIKEVLLTITPCFLYHYRPMKNEVVIDFKSDWVGPYEHDFTAPGYFDGLKAFPGILHSCTMDYLENPSKFKGLPTSDIPKLRISKVMSKCSQFQTKYCFGVDRFDDCDRTDSLRWKMQYPQYNQSLVGFQHLTSCVLRHPPVNDPVYQRIASIFPKHMKRSNVIDDPKDDKQNPRFTRP